jgi:methylenetetrahydrofolate dehydrogenase (NADP+) / methenyltetrahydrofolate cyclohydrolase
MNLIDGKKISLELREELKKEVAELKESGVEPGLATILVGEDPASKVYVASKIKACKEIGMRSFSFEMPASSTEEEIIRQIEKLNDDSRVNGILLQLPLPKGPSPDRCVAAISPKKDADGLHPSNLGKLLSAKSWEDIEKNKLFIPCTPFGIMHMLNKTGVQLSGKRAVVIGRSNLVGKPIAVLLLSANATVTMAHSKTGDLAGLCKSADIVVAAIGKPLFVTKDFVKKGAVVIDVGMNRTKDGLVGDVDFENVKDIASYITPVPGGVGPMTITMLMKNTVLSARLAYSK